MVNKARDDPAIAVSEMVDRPLVEPYGRPKTRLSFRLIVGTAIIGTILSTAAGKDSLGQDRPLLGICPIRVVGTTPKNITPELIVSKLTSELNEKYETIGQAQLLDMLQEAGITADPLSDLSFAQIAKDRLPQGAKLKRVQYILNGTLWNAPSGRLWLTVRLCEFGHGKVTSLVQARDENGNLLMEQVPALAKQLLLAGTQGAEFNLIASGNDTKTLKLRMEQAETIGEELAEARLALPEDDEWAAYLQKTFDDSAQQIGQAVAARVKELDALVRLLNDEDMPNDPLRNEMADEVASLQKRLRTGYLGNIFLEKEIQLDLSEDVSMKLVLISKGKFIMGSPADEQKRYGDEGPAHPVTISKAFYLGALEVTQKQFEAVVRGAPQGRWRKETYVPPAFECSATPSRFTGPDRPVESVTWKDAIAFCKEVSRRTGRVVRLPTEAEWEYACRGGSKFPFSTGQTIDADHANYDGTYVYGAGPSGEYRMETQPVGSLRPNAWGLYDMHGNVWEWCSDWYAPYNPQREVNPTGPAKGEMRVCRGGSWVNYPWQCRSACRNRMDFEDSASTVGFRVACEVDEEAADKAQPRGAN